MTDSPEPVKVTREHLADLEALLGERKRRMRRDNRKALWFWVAFGVFFVLVPQVILLWGWNISDRVMMHLTFAILASNVVEVAIALFIYSKTLEASEILDQVQGIVDRMNQNLAEVEARVDTLMKRGEETMVKYRQLLDLAEETRLGFEKAKAEADKAGISLSEYIPTMQELLVTIKSIEPEKVRNLVQRATHFLEENEWGAAVAKAAPKEGSHAKK